MTGPDSSGPDSSGPDSSGPDSSGPDSSGHDPDLRVRFWLIDTGYCTVREDHVIRGAERRPLKTHALAVLLEHPRAGRIVFDTGYAPRVLEAFKHFPFQMYAALTPVVTRSDWTLVAQLARLGLGPENISRVIVSHFHADHIGGLRDFPNSRLIASGQALRDVRGTRGLSALRRAFLPALMPNVHPTEVATGRQDRFETIDSFADAPLEGLGNTHDVLGDGSVRLVNLPGHARGQIGLFARTTIGPVLFAADGAWTSASVRENRPPAPLALALVGSPRETLRTLRNLHDFGQAHPEVWIVPTHCPEVASLITPGQPRAFTGRP
jgi:glyoxylase-like metal-dependent hydrolase (beta-lactamase superfamily II)